MARGLLAHDELAIFETIAEGELLPWQRRHVEELRDLMAEQRGRVDHNRRFRFVLAQEVAQQPDPEWLLEGVLERESVAVLYGAQATFKSFLALDWACCAATGAAWHTRAMVPGFVVYVAAEGFKATGKRLRAWATRRSAWTWPSFANCSTCWLTIPCICWKL